MRRFVGRAAGLVIAGGLLVGHVLAEPDAARETQIKHRRLPIEPARTVRFETEEGSHLNLDLSPDGKLLVFDLLGDIYTMPVSGGRATQLTRGLGMDTWPVWSPDGKQIAYITDLTGSDNIWVMNADGSGQRPVSGEDQEVSSAAEWTPDGALFSVSANAAYTGKASWIHALDGTRRAAPKGLYSNVRFGADRRYAYFAGRKSVHRVDWQSGAITELLELPVFGSSYMVSPDGQWLVYVTTARGESHSYGLRTRRLSTGEDRWLAYPVSRFEPFANRAVFTPDSAAVIVNFGGRLHRLDLATGADARIPFSATVNADLGPLKVATRRLDTQPFTVGYTRSAHLSPDGKTLVFSALGRLYTMAFPEGRPQPLPAQSAGQFQPAFSPDGKWIAYVTWSESEGGHIYRAPAAGGGAQRLTRVSGRYQNPVWSPDGSLLAAVKESPIDQQKGPFIPTEGTLIVMPGSGGPARALAHELFTHALPSFTADGERLFFAVEGPPGDGQGNGLPRLNTELRSVRLDGTDRKTHLTVESTPLAPAVPPQVLPSPDGRYVAYTIHDDLYLAPMPTPHPTAKLGDSAGGGVVRLTTSGGIDPHWSADGSILSWSFGNRFFSIDPQRALAAPSGARIAADRSVEIALSAPTHYGKGTIAMRGARVVTMKGDDVIENGTLVIKDARIVAVGPAAAVKIPAAAHVLDLEGKTIIPGLIDMHAHNLLPPTSVLSQQDWVYLVNLAYGITTMRDPSATVVSLGYRELVQSGQMIGPRVFTAGVPVQPARADLESAEHARAVVSQYQALGADLIKQYEQRTRIQRQWLVQAAREAGINLTNEGGFTYSGNPRAWLSMVIDGSPGIEHDAGLAETYYDVHRLIAESGTWVTPTLVVSSAISTGDGMGVWYFYDRYRPGRDEKYRRFVPPSAINWHMRGARIERSEEPPFMPLARYMARILKLGGRVTMGGHGNEQALSAHWDIWAMQMGGMSPLEALRAATLLGAEGLGVERDLGSLEVGKLADLVVLNQNPLQKIEHTLDAHAVMKNGELFDGNTMDQIWPQSRTLPPFRRDDRPARGH